ncbi:MAG: hypothetical protein O2899_07465 [Bacteroidetes bacterium]|nr:hypothetical protein [Bacteroidota bacterium]
MARGLDVDLDAGWNRISDLGHELGASKSAFTASISATWRLTGHRALP